MNRTEVVRLDGNVLTTRERNPKHFFNIYDVLCQCLWILRFNLNAVRDLVKPFSKIGRAHV